MTEENWKKRRFDQIPREGDFRTEYQRDHARLIHSAAFRRLQAKTQILGLGESDFYRTRLTHSMEVAQIGTSINFFLYKKYDENFDKPLIASRALMNTICLAHDIGHPPFGHGGEVALNYCMRDYGGFEGNGQTLRILSKLGKYTENHGLNPTRRTLLGVLKYPARYSEVVNMNVYDAPVEGKPNWLFKSKQQHPPKCYLDCDYDVVDWILEPLNGADRNLFTQFKSDRGKHGKSQYKSLDTSIMELADDISYGVHDLEDAIALKMID